MIVTPTRSALAYGGVESLVRPSLEEHLFERISELESSVLRAHERIETLLNLIHRQATNGLYDHARLDALVEHLSEKDFVEDEELESLWRNRIAAHYEEVDEQELLTARLKSVMNDFKGENLDLFSRLIEMGADLLLDGNQRRGIRYFEKALLLDPANLSLAFFIGEHFFRINKPLLAQSYLQRVVDKEEANYSALLMLGVICGDDGNLDLAKSYLQRALKLKKNSFTAHYGLGRIFVSEGKLPEAITHLKRALTLRPTPEMYYIVGRAYLEDGRTDIAVRHLRRCIEMDPKFDAALYHLGLIYLGQENHLLAQEHFRAAYEINPRETRYRIALRTRKAGRLAPLPVFGRATVSSRKVVTSGDVRLAELIRNDLFNSPPNGIDRKGHKRG